MPMALDSDISLLIRDDSKLVALLVSALIFLVIFGIMVIVYIALEARRISKQQDISQWRRPVPRGPEVAKSWGDHSVWFQEHQLKSYTQKYTPTNTLQPNNSTRKSIQI